VQLAALPLLLLVIEGPDGVRGLAPVPTANHS
jgi:hypothetical protein